MNVYFSSFSQTMAVFGGNFLSSLNKQQEKVQVVVLVIFGFLMTCCIVNYRYSKFKRLKQGRQEADKEVLKEKEKSLDLPYALVDIPEGLNVMGICKNNSCKSYNNSFVIPKGFGSFNYFEIICRTQCSLCHSQVFDKDIDPQWILNSCTLCIEGIQILGQDKIKMLKGVVECSLKSLQFDPSSKWKYLTLDVSKV